MYHYIDDDVKIDFKISKDIQNMIDLCEKEDINDNYPAYCNYVEFLLYTMCKEACYQGHITKKQWELLERRYLL